MLYQKILMDNSPYYLKLQALREFLEHRHTDFEFNYCVHGSISVIIDKKRYDLKRGDMSLISPGISHEFHSDDSSDRLILTGVFGSSFLKKHFAAFSGASFKSPVISLDESRCELKKSLDSIAELIIDTSPKNQLLITAELYRVCALLLDEIEYKNENKQKNDLDAVARIDEALEMIFYSYKLPITVDDAAAATGYGKSNFCKIFKSITGFGFHEALNQRRVSVAEGLLSKTSLSISEISEEVGFSEAKSFCRVFKSVIGMTPGEYRKSARNNL